MSNLSLSSELVSSIDALYKPSIIVEDNVEKGRLEAAPMSELNSVEQSAFSFSTVGCICCNFIAGYTQYEKGCEPLWSKLFSRIDSITGKKQLREARKYLEDLNNYLSDLVEKYKKEQKELASSIGHWVTMINLLKSQFKEKTLLTVSRKLYDIGIKNDVGEYNYEELDENVLKINSELQEILAHTSRMTASSKLADFYVYCALIFNPLLAIWIRRKRANQIKQKIAILKQESALANEKIQSDIKRLALFNAALKNVSYIYEDIQDNLTPIINAIIVDIEKKYGNNIDNIPENVWTALIKACRILKQMAEKSILGKEVNTKEVIDYSNQLSHSYNNVKTHLKAAI